MLQSYLFWVTGFLLPVFVHITMFHKQDLVVTSVVSLFHVLLSAFINVSKAIKISQQLENYAKKNSTGWVLVGRPFYVVDGWHVMECYPTH